MKQFPFSSFLSPDTSWAHEETLGIVLCPICHGNYQSFEDDVKITDGQDSGKAMWGGRGDLLSVPFKGECGSTWEICFGFHKGQTFVFGKVTHSCREK